MQVKITKIKKWYALCFSVDDKKFLLHHSSEGGECHLTLYERELDYNGRFKLTELTSSDLIWCGEHKCKNNVTNLIGGVLVYKKIEIDKFIERLLAIFKVESIETLTSQAPHLLPADNE